MENNLLKEKLWNEIQHKVISAPYKKEREPIASAPTHLYSRITIYNQEISTFIPDPKDTVNLDKLFKLVNLYPRSWNIKYFSSSIFFSSHEKEVRKHMRSPLEGSFIDNILTATRELLENFKDYEIEDYLKLLLFMEMSGLNWQVLDLVLSTKRITLDFKKIIFRPIFHSLGVHINGKISPDGKPLPLYDFYKGQTSMKNLVAETIGEDFKLSKKVIPLKDNYSFILKECQYFIIQSQYKGKKGMIINPNMKSREKTQVPYAERWINLMIRKDKEFIIQSMDYDTQNWEGRTVFQTLHGNKLNWTLDSLNQKFLLLYKRTGDEAFLSAVVNHGKITLINDQDLTQGYKLCREPRAAEYLRYLRQHFIKSKNSKNKLTGIFGVSLEKRSS